MKNFISVHDISSEDNKQIAINKLIEKTLQFKANPQAAKDVGKGKRIGCLFFSPSMRTRISTQIAAENLGMQVITFNLKSDGWQLEMEEGVVMNGSSVEHIKDAAPVLSAYFDILAIRSFPSLQDREKDYSEFFINQFVKYCTIPIVSLESATLHPLQSLADVATISEHINTKNFKQKNSKPKIVLAWAPHIKPIPQCVGNSFAQWINAWKIADFTIANPKGFDLKTDYTQGATITNNLDEALQDADFVYVKNWSSFENYGEVLQNANEWMLTLDKLKNTNQAKIMHCLPVRRNVELSDEVLDSQHSIITEEAGNRVWAAQAVLGKLIMENKK